MRNLRGRQQFMAARGGLPERFIFEHRVNLLRGEHGLTILRHSYNDPNPLVPTLCVGTQERTLRVPNQGRPIATPSGDAERPDFHSHAERGNEEMSMAEAITP